MCKDRIEAWRCYRRMSSVSPRETSGALPKWDSIQSTDKNTVINPILRTYQEVTRAVGDDFDDEEQQEEECNGCGDDGGGSNGGGGKVATAEVN